ncbi:MAG: HAMP domain-containing histidine kinase [Bacteriovoracaceae bacterium]|jgi:signal transduction histidine kinase|nr:HAMP domain-containing histidine kinase [Bacteriovoracaceae bacterium]
MELNKPKKLFFLGTSVLTSFLFLMGVWWLYLVFKLAKQIENHDIPNQMGNLFNMIKWEGAVFLLLILFISIAHAYMYFADRKKSKSIGLFFASLTHELKTPLASIKLQAQVLNDLILSNKNLENGDKSALSTYSGRLQESTMRLENELDNHLQLARIERDGVLNTAELEFKSKLQAIIKNYPTISFDIKDFDELYILSDSFALDTILKNLFENTLRHVKNENKNIIIKTSQVDSLTKVTISDNGEEFSGDITKLGKLFYKHDSPKGSGLGLYLVRSLMLKMNGRFEISSLNNKLQFNLYFQRGENG